jgi:hypothetical protein
MQSLETMALAVAPGCKTTNSHQEHEMKLSLRKRMIAGAIATLLAAPAWAASVTADDPAKARTGAQTGSELKSDTERSSGTGTSQSGSTSGTTSGAAGAGTTESTRTGAQTGSEMKSDSARTGTTGSAGASTSAAGTASRSTAMGAGTTRLNADNPLYSRTVDELEGTDIVDASGDEIGEIDKVVLTQDRRTAHAVVSVGGFLGIGEHHIAVSLDELRPAADDKLQLNATKEELKARPKYQSEQYVELEGNDPISGSITDFAAFETDRDKTRDKTMNKSMDKTMDKDKTMRQPSTTGSGAAGTSGGTTGSGATGSGGTTGSGATK